MGTAAQMVATARGELGAGCPGKYNKYSNWYGMPGQAWCAMFVSWVADRSGNAGVVPKHSYTPSGAAWFKARGQWSNGIAGIRPGDIVYFDFPDSVYRIQHVGVCESVGSGGIYTIEGNTSSASQANGGCVQRKWRTVKGGVVGYGRPLYGTVAQKNWLEKGDSGESVKDLQRQLVAAGFSVGGYGVDGVYGNDTFTAVVAYQVSRGLEPDGVAGPITRGALSAGMAPIRRNADGSLTIDEDGVRGPVTIARWQEVMGTLVDGSITKLSKAPNRPSDYLIGRDQKFLNSVVSSDRIRALTGRTQLVVDAIEGPSTIKVRQSWLFDRYCLLRLGRSPRQGDFDGVSGHETNTLHQYALNQATAGSGRY